MYEPIFRAFQLRHPLPAGQRTPAFEEIVETLWKGLKNRVSRVWNYDRGVENPDEGYDGAEKPAESDAAKTAYLMFSTKSRT